MTEQSDANWQCAGWAELLTVLPGRDDAARRSAARIRASTASARARAAAPRAASCGMTARMRRPRVRPASAAAAVFGIGWGNVGPILGTDERGAAYTASNVWLEIALGAGIIGLVGLFGAIAYVAARALIPAIRYRERSGDMSAVPLILAFLVIFLVFNLFNAGLLIGVVWIAFAVFPPLLPSKISEKKAV